MSDKPIGHIFVSFIAVISLLVVTRGAAEPIPDNHSPYSYLGARLGLANFSNACASSALRCDQHSAVYGAFVGHQVSPYFALELGLTDYGHIEAQYESLVTSVEAYSADVTALVTYDLDNQWRLFARGGAAWLDIDKKTDTGSNSNKQSSNEWTGVLGVGADYQLSKEWSVRGEYQFMDGFGAGSSGQSDLHLASFALSYRFGGVEAAP